MKFKFNPLTGEFNLVPDSGTLKQKLNWLTGNFNLTKDAGKYKQTYNAIEGEFNLRPAVTQVVVHGVGSIQLTNAVENGLLSLKAFGGTEQRNLPSGYTQQQYVYMQESSYLLTNIVPTPDCKIEFDFQTLTIASSARTYLGCRDTSGSNNGLRVAHVSSGNFRIYGFGTYTDASTTAQNNTRYKFVWDNKRATVTSGDTTIFDNTFEAEGTNQTAIAINGWNTAGTVDANSEGMYLYSFKVWDNQGNLIADYVPAVQIGTVPVVGFYDTVSKTFKTATSGTFTAGADAVPTPATPMDIVSNNGVLKARHQSGLPLGYTLLDYIASSGTQYIDTGVYVATGYKVRVKAYATSVPTTIAFFGCTSTASSSDANKGIYRIFGSSINRCAWGNGGGSVVGNLTGNDSINTWYDMVCDNGVWTINDTLFATVPASSFTAEYSMWLFARNTGGTVGLPASCRISVCQIWDNNGQMIGNFVPAKNSSNVVGMYDLVSEQFFTNQGTGDFVAGTAVSDPVEIYADGTVETINVHGKNLFDEQWNRNTGTSTAAATWGQVVTASGWSTSNLVPVQTGQQYTISYNTTTQIYVFYYEADGTMQQRYDTTSSTKKTFTVPDGATQIRLQVNKSTEAQIAELEAQLEKGATATTYEPYYDGGTATAEMLLKVGDYTDIHEVLSGDITRNVGIKVLDGTESWSVASTNVLQADVFNANTAQPSPNGYCNILVFTNSSTLSGMPENSFRLGSSVYPRRLYVKSSTYATDTTTWKQYLKDQYDNGTPVMVLYSLETPTTESVTGQTMDIQAGNNTIEITQASLDNLELEAVYEQEA